MIMSREMKDSGVEEIGMIPNNWNLAKLWLLFNAKAGGDAKLDLYSDICDKEHPYPVYTNSSIETQVYAYSTTPMFKENTITVTGRGDIGRAFFRDHPYDAIIRLISLSPIKELDCKYYTYWINEAIIFFTDNAAIGQLSAAQIGQYMVSVLPLNEQKKISSYLDEQRDVIDKIVVKTKQTIEEYKKLKQTIITEAVTKGIRKNRPMKDSGIEWIGEIPENWVMLRGKGLFVESDVRSTDGVGELLTVSQYTGVTPRSYKNVNMFEAESLENYKICKIGDIAANTMWLWAGAIGVSQYDGLISPSYNVYQQKNNSYLSKYLDHLLRTPKLVQCFESLSTGIRSSRLRLYPQQFLGIYYPVPPIEEQKEIVDYLNVKCSEINMLISNKENLLDELESYKKSLIYEYVTGKKQVP